MSNQAQQIDLSSLVASINSLNNSIGANGRLLVAGIQAISPLLSNNLPLVDAQNASPGVLNSASRTDHVHPAFPVGPGGRLTFSASDPRPSNAEGVTIIYYLPYIHDWVSVPNPNGSGLMAMSIPVTGVANHYNDATTNPAVIPAAAVQFDLYLWNRNGVLTLSRGNSNSITTGAGIAAPTPGLAFGAGGMVVNSANITNGPAQGMGLYVGTAWTYTTGASYWRQEGLNGGLSPNNGNYFCLSNYYNKLAATTSIPYSVGTNAPGNRHYASEMFYAVSNTSGGDNQPFTTQWGFGGSGIAAGSYSGVFLRAGYNSAVQTPNLDWYCISFETQGTTTAVCQGGTPNIQRGCWTAYLGTSDSAFTTISAWGRASTEFTTWV